MTEEQKMELLRVVAASKETAQREEAVRQGHFAPVKHYVPPVSTAFGDHITWDRKGPTKAGHATSPQDWWATEGSDDDEWPTPSSAKQSRPARRQPVILKYPHPSSCVHPSLQSTVRRVYCMEQRLNFHWGKGDEPELEDARLSRLGLNAQGSAGPTVQCNGGWKDPLALLESWASMHNVLKQAQSSSGLPLRPWTECREAPPSLLSIQDSRPREFGEESRMVTSSSSTSDSSSSEDKQTSGLAMPGPRVLVMPEPSSLVMPGCSGLVMPGPSAFGTFAQRQPSWLVMPGPSGLGTSMHGQHMCNSRESTPEIPSYYPEGWGPIRRCHRSRWKRNLLMKSTVNLGEVMKYKREEKGPDLGSASAMDASGT